VLDSFVEKILIKIDKDSISSKGREATYVKILSLIDDTLKTGPDIKEQKILRYIKNHIYLKQQQEKIGR